MTQRWQNWAISLISLSFCDNKSNTPPILSLNCTKSSSIPSYD